MGSGSVQAASRVAQILVGYEDIPEELATKMLANDMLLDQVRQADTPAKQQELVKLELDASIDELMEERSSFEQQSQELRHWQREAKEQLAEKDAALRQSEEQRQNDLAAAERERQEQAVDVQIAEEIRRQEDAEAQQKRERQRQEKRATSAAEKSGR